jgi:cysteinyl-tRNA synthetase
MVGTARRKYVSTSNDPVKAWQEMVDQLSKTASGSETPEFLQAMFAPMQQQFDLLQQAFEKQAEFQRQLTERALGPMKQMLNEMQKAAETARAAGDALRQAGDMLTKQADAMDQALKLAKPFVETAFPSRKESGAK